MLDRLRSYWTRFWMLSAGIGIFPRTATRLATWFVPPYYKRITLARIHPRGYTSPSATICHSGLRMGANVFIDDNVLIYQGDGGGEVELADCVHLYRDTIIQTGRGGSLTVGPYTHIQPRCQFSAYMSPIRIGSYVQIAPNCAFYPYDHGFAAGQPIWKQPLRTKGGIIIDDDAWLGVGVIVLDGVRIGRGAVIGAGSVVTHDVPDGAVAAGVPARVVRMRSDHGSDFTEEVNKDAGDREHISGKTCTTKGQR